MRRQLSDPWGSAETSGAVRTRRHPRYVLRQMRKRGAVAARPEVVVLRAGRARGEPARSVVTGIATAGRQSTEERAAIRRSASRRRIESAAAVSAGAAGITTSRITGRISGIEAFRAGGTR